MCNLGGRDFLKRDILQRGGNVIQSTNTANKRANQVINLNPLTRTRKEDEYTSLAKSPDGGEAFGGPLLKVKVVEAAIFRMPRLTIRPHTDPRFTILWLESESLRFRVVSLSAV